MPTQVRSYRFNDDRNYQAIVLGNCPMCGMAGRLGKICATGCQEGDDLADERTGGPVRNDQSRSHKRCRYQAIVMPDERTVVSALWYQGVVNGTGTVGRAIDRRFVLSDRTPSFLLERGCIHHRTILAMAESVGVNFPPGNAADSDTESE